MARASVQLRLGEYSAAYDGADSAVRLLEQLSIAEADGTGGRIRDNLLQHALGLMSDAALRLGRYAEAETTARRRLALPTDPFADPDEDRSRRQVMLAHAIARQGRGPEAQAVLEPALAYYLREQQAGATGADFRAGYAEALYVSALAQGMDPAGRAARQRALNEASALLSGASAELRQLTTARELMNWIAAARSAPGA